ncbi:MAG: spondin domain-containing protein [Sandaracinaceae bacterium]|nr:spondin domain-containing protein [Sandaracinaceae bacterium]
MRHGHDARRAREHRAGSCARRSRRCPTAARARGRSGTGERYVFTITADPLHPRFNLFAMPYPSNDMFVALAPEGLALLDASGEPRSDEDIMADVRRTFRVWDAGTESNQAGASGRDGVPLQAGHHMGAPEGDGTVRREADPIYAYPAAAELVRVVIVPQEDD